MTTTAPRRAVTLTEVLIAIFLMGIGLMAILSLFPLGAAQMAQALKDQRAAEQAANSIGSLRVSWKRSYDASTTGTKFDPGTTGVGPTAPQPIQEQNVESYVYALDDVYAMQRDITATAPFGTRPPGDNTLITIYTRTGHVTAHPVDPSGLLYPPPNTNMWNPFKFTQDGLSSGQ